VLSVPERNEKIFAKFFRQFAGRLHREKSFVGQIASHQKLKTLSQKCRMLRPKLAQASPW
jgi:hypothetical protein